VSTVADTSTPPNVTLRFAVPTSPVASMNSGTYFRLGGYNATEESSLILPAITYSKSIVSSAASTPPELSQTGAEVYNNPDYGLSATDPSKVTNYDRTDGRSAGNLTEDRNDGSSTGLVRNRTANFEQLVISTTKTAETRQTHGILAKTNGDMVANVGAGGIFRFGKGVVVASADGDIELKAPEGVVSVATKSGISMTAGSAGAPANISMTAFGYVKQTAYGPLSDVRFATSSIKTYGWSKEWFYGERFFEIHGTSTSNLYGVDQRANFAEQRYVTFAARIHFSLSTSLDVITGLFTQITVALRLELGLAGSIRFTKGFEFKFVTWFDIKLVGIDLKIVDLDSKLYKTKVEGGSLTDFHAAAMKSDNAFAKAVASNLAADAGNLYNSTQVLRSLI
jgi:hypothetical protein